MNAAAVRAQREEEKTSGLMTEDQFNRLTIIIIKMKLSSSLIN